MIEWARIALNSFTIVFTTINIDLLWSEREESVIEANKDEKISKRGDMKRTDVTKGSAWHIRTVGPQLAALQYVYWCSVTL